MHNIMKTILTFLLLLLLNACGASNYKATDSNTTSVHTTNINGIVVDGYISGATVCIDTNNDALCSSSEPSTTTDSNGNFSFKAISLEEDSIISLISFGGIDTSTNLDHKGELKRVLNSSTLSNNPSVVVSPMTDLVAMSVLNSQNIDILTLHDAVVTISSLLEVTAAQIDQDPMKDIKLFAKSQEIQHTKLMIETAIEKNENPSFTKPTDFSLEEFIKDEMIQQNLNINNILIASEINLDMSIPQNEKIYVVAQIQELQTTLNTLAQDTSLDIANLNRLQESILNKQTEANQKLVNSSDITEITVVSMEITNDTITQSDFDTTDAILDNKACKETNYNILTNDNLALQKSDDLSNGISIRSEYKDAININNSEVKLFYPDLQNTKTESNVVFFETDYYFVFNKAWVNNIDKTIYLMTPKDIDGLHKCYRYELNSENSNEITATKVYSYADIL
ncbi:hypothetical protein GJV85_00230 [Sulfurimonas aquatica]|uniref:Carboxypeptidase regulatory-like domain-containing protein n=1 Tax=Sulfurimonas aquatica TaxID=2672570 RepID=A0A975AY28_9BACT|nr:hypothetical protein [Sulfurimonas aquatica]QSZ40608.1 hypothetical protein GJV85_00230 [Sulfurimonas aquatica]